jgi:hypothetical protein
MYGESISAAKPPAYYFAVSRNNADVIVCAAQDLARAVYVSGATTVKVKILTFEQFRRMSADPLVRVLR